MQKPLIYGHRGASVAAPENTLEAFGLARELGADGVELDVRRSADGALVLHHDADLRDGRTIVATHRSELPTSIPTLSDALDTCAGMVVNVEIKNIPGESDFDETCALADAVAELLEQRRNADRVVVSSFHLATIDRVKHLAPHVRTGFLTLVEPTAAASIGLAHRRGHDAIHPHHLFVDEDLVATAAAAGLEINTWTVDDPETFQRLAALGVDGVVTNVPDVAVATLR